MNCEVFVVMLVASAPLWVGIIYVLGKYAVVPMIKDMVKP